MFNYEKTFLDAKSEQTGFVRYNLEKVYRLIDVLNFINNDPFLSGRLALKGGTAINLVFFDLPRLSVDIDLDYMIDCDRETMLVERKQIEETLTKHMCLHKGISFPQNEIKMYMRSVLRFSIIKA